MELDDAFKMAVRKFYDGSTHKNVDKYSKTPFKYSFSELDELQKSYKKGKVVPEESEELTEPDVTDVEEPLEMEIE